MRHDVVHLPGDAGAFLGPGLVGAGGLLPLQSRGPLPDVVEACLAAGLRGLQLREKDLPVRDLLDLALTLRESTRRHGARLMVNDRADVALAAAADGVQRTHESLPVALLRTILPHGLIGASVLPSLILAACQM